MGCSRIPPGTIAGLKARQKDITLQQIAEVMPRCPCRSDIAASPELWAEVKRAWRRRSKTTVIEVGPKQILGTTHAAAIVVSDLKTRTSVRHLLGHLMPSFEGDRPCKLTIRVDFEPEEEM